MLEIKQLFNQTVIYGFSSVIARILNFFLVPLYTILFIPSEYAVVTEMYAYAALFMVIGSFGMETAFFRYITQFNKTKFSSVFSSAFLFLMINSLIIIFLGCLFYKPIAGIIGYAHEPNYILYFAFIIGVDLMCVIPFALLRQQNKALKFAVVKTINILINIFCNLFFLLLLPHLIKKGIAWPIIDSLNFSVSVKYIFLSNLIASAVTILILSKDVKNNLATFHPAIFKKMLSYAWPILIAGLAFVINETADKIFIKYLLPQGIAMRELGIYSACYKLTIFMTLFVQAYRFAAEPFFFNQFKRPHAKEIYSMMLQVFVLFALSIFLLIVFYIDLIKLLIPNPLYHEGIKIIPIVLLANICLGVYYNLSVWYKVTNKTRYAAIISSLGSIVTIFLNLLLIPVFGYMGAAWSTLACYATMMIISFYLGQKNFKIQYNLFAIIKYFLIALLLFYLSQFFNAEVFDNIQIDNTVFFFLYIIFIYVQLKDVFKKNKQYAYESRID